MMNKQRKTLQLHGVDGRTLLLIALFLGVYIVTAELLIRTQFARSLLGVPSLGSEHKQFEQQWTRLEDEAARGNNIDCIVLGDSAIMTDFDPTSFAEAYRAQTGHDLTCYNFGVGAFTAVGLASLAQILADEYTPRLLIVGVQALNFTVPAEEQGPADLSQLAWGRYKMGALSPKGWLYDHLYAYRYLGVLGQVFTFNIRVQDTVEAATGGDVPLKGGYYPMEKPGPFDVSQPPDPTREHPYLEHYFAALGAFQLLPENLTAFDSILALDNDTTRIVLLEIPVPHTFYTFFGGGKLEYDRFVNTISQRATADDVLFLRMDDLQLNGPMWFNYNHLNATGAPIFSHWLGTKLGSSFCVLNYLEDFPCK